jgi:hypothetical protein
MQIRRGVRPWQRPETDDRRTTVKEVNQLSVAISSIRIELINKLFAFCNNKAMKGGGWIDILCRGFGGKRYGMQPSIQESSRQIQEVLIDMIDWNLIWKDAFLASRLTGDSCSFSPSSGCQGIPCAYGRARDQWFVPFWSALQADLHSIVQSNSIDAFLHLREATIMKLPDIRDCSYLSDGCYRNDRCGNDVRERICTMSRNDN